MAKCNQDGCDKRATHEYVWPTDGKTKQSCQEHTRAARKILSTLGFSVKIKELAPEEPKIIETTGITTEEKPVPPTREQLERWASKKFNIPPDIEEFCLHVGEVTQNVEAIDGEYIYRLNAQYVLRPMGFLIWADASALLKSIKIHGQEQIAMDNGVPIYSLINPYASLDEVFEWLSRGLRLSYTNLALPSMQAGAEIIMKTDAPAVIALCGIKLKEG